jgi:hypothetical protein
VSLMEENIAKYRGSVKNKTLLCAYGGTRLTPWTPCVTG